MKVATRIRIVLFALMIFGAFSNFALNEWGDALIVWCEFFMALSFLGEIGFTLYKRIKTKDKIKLSKFILGLTGLMALSVMITLAFVILTKTSPSVFPFLIVGSFLALGITIVVEAVYDFIKKIETQLNYENFFLFVFYTALFFKNSSFPGASPLLVSSMFFLIPYFLVSTIKFFNSNYKHGKGLISVLTIGSIATIIFGMANFMKTMHWPGATLIFYLAFLITLFMIVGAVKWNYEFNGQKVNILYGLKLFKTNIILLFFILFVFSVYRNLASMKLAPGFYTADYPDSFNRYRNNGTEEDWKKAYQIREAYEKFTQKAEKNGFLK